MILPILTECEVYSADECSPLCPGFREELQDCRCGCGTSASSTPITSGSTPRSLPKSGGAARRRLSSGARTCCGRSKRIEAASWPRQRLTCCSWRQREIEAERREPLSRSLIREIKDVITQDLRRTTPPKTRTVDVIYDPRVSEVWLGTTSKSLTETFCALWINTFGGSLAHIGPECVSADAGAVQPEPLFLIGRPDLRPCTARDEDAPHLPASDKATDLRFLGREFLTWLLFAAKPGDEVAIGQRVRLQALGDTVRDIAMAGLAPSEAADVRYAIAGGHHVRSVEVLFTQGDEVFTVTIDAETMDLSRAKLPDLEYDSNEDALLFRLEALTDLVRLVASQYAGFVAMRSNPAKWRPVVDRMRAWMSEAVVR